MEYRLDNTIEKIIVQLYRDKLRKKLGTPEKRTVPIIRNKLKELGLIKSRKKLENIESKVDNMIVVYKEKGRVTKHATCIVGELDFHWVIAGGNGRVLLPKEGKYEFYSYEK